MPFRTPLRRCRRAATAAVGAALVLAASLGVSPATSAAQVLGAAAAAPAATVLAPTPPMGFNDWLNFGCGVSEKLITGVADAFVNLGLKDAGYQYVNIDDCWAARSRAADGSLQADPTKFPHGMKWLADYIHARGLKFGIYSAASPTTCAGYPGSDGHYAQDMRTFASWGVDYLKLDLCGSAANTLIQQHCDDTVASREFQQRYAQARAAIDASGRPMILAVSAPASIAYWCGYDNVSYRDAMSWAPDYGELWRTAVDAGQNWPSILKTYTQNVTLAPYQSIDHWNDADMLVAGSRNVSLIEQQTQFTLWSEMAAPLLISTDLTRISPESLAILKNRDVIAIDQDPLGKQGTVVASGTGYDILSKPLAGGDRAVVLFNKGDTAQTIATDAGTVGFTQPGTYFLTDLVTKQRTRTRGTIAASVPPHGTVIYRVSNHSQGDGPAGPATALRIQHADLTPGMPTPVTVTVSDNGPTPVSDVDVRLVAPDRWTVTPANRHLSRVEGDSSAEVTFAVTAPAQRPGRTVSTLTGVAAYDYPAGRSSITGLDTVVTDVPYPNLAAAFNNVGITDDSNPAPGNMDGSGDSYSAQALADAGLTPGSEFRHNGIVFTWPDVPAGTPDNVAGGGATIALAGSGSTLAFLGAGIGQSVSGTGTITYADGSTQQFTLSFPNWADGTPGDAVVLARYRNTPSGPANYGYYYRIFYAGVPIADKQLASVTLPTTSALHIFAMSAA